MFSRFSVKHFFLLHNVAFVWHLTHMTHMNRSHRHHEMFQLARVNSDAFDFIKVTPRGPEHKRF
jgi:hypothetical protein